MKNWIQKSLRNFLVGQEPQKWFVDWAGGGSSSGIQVTENTALNLTSIFACAQVLQQTVGSIPLKLYKTVAEGKEPATEHPLYEVLSLIANPEMTAYTWKGVVMAHCALYNQHFSEVQRTKGGQIYALWPIAPWRVRILRSIQDNRLLYEVQYEQGKTVLEAHEMLHIKGLSMDGIMGLDRIRLAKEALGNGLAAQRSAGKSFANDNRPSGVLEHPQVIDNDVAKRLRESWEMIHSGVDNSHRIAILEQGMKFTPMSITPEQAQLLESRIFSVEEVARIFRMPLHKIQSMKQSTNNNIEMQAMEFVSDTIMPWCVNIEQEISMKLLTSSERKTYFPKFNLSSLLRADIKARYEAYKTGMNNGFMNADQVCEMEDWNNLPSGIGNKYFMPVNMAEVTKEKFTPAQSPAQLSAQ